MPITDWSEPSSNFTWLDIINPTEDELKSISEKYKLHHYTLRDCLEPDHLPKHEDLGDTQFIITRVLNKAGKTKGTGRRYLSTSQGDLKRNQP